MTSELSQAYSSQSLNPEALATAHFVKLCIQFSSVVLVYYDYILTFELEITYMWRGKFNFSTILYIFSRYAMVANLLCLLAMTKTLSSKVFPHVTICHPAHQPTFNHLHCDMWYRINGVLSIIGRASVITVFSIRTYVLWDKSRLVLAWLATLGIGCLIVDVLHIPGLKCYGPPPSQIRSFLSGMPPRDRPNEPATAATLLSLLVCILELSVAVLTVWSLMRSHSVRKCTGTLTKFIMKQGVIYFCGVFAFTFAALVLNLAVKPSNFLNKLLNAMTLPISCIFTSRFILRLRSFSFLAPTASKTQARGSSTAHSELAFAHAATTKGKMAEAGVIHEFSHVDDSEDSEDDSTIDFSDVDTDYSDETRILVHAERVAQPYACNAVASSSRQTVENTMC